MEKRKRLKEEYSIYISLSRYTRKGAFSQFLVNALKTFRVTKEQTGKEFNFADVPTPSSKSSGNQLKIYSGIPSHTLNQSRV